MFHMSDCFRQFGMCNEQRKNIEQICNENVSHVFMPPCSELPIKLVVSCEWKHVRFLNEELKDERINIFVTFGYLNPKATEANGIRDKIDDTFHRFLSSFDKDVLMDTDSFVRRLLQYDFHLHAFTRVHCTLVFIWLVSLGGRRASKLKVFSNDSGSPSILVRWRLICMR